jgi:hypothetical protein
MVANLAISLVVLAVTLRTVSPRRLVGYCRGQAPGTRGVAPVAGSAQPDPAVTNS